MKTKKILLATLITLTPLPNSTLVKYSLEKVNPKILIQQLTQKPIKTPQDQEKPINYRTINHNNTTYHVIQIKNNNDYEIEIITTNKPRFLENVVNENTYAAINASFFTEEKTIGLVKSKGTIKNPQARIRGSGYFVTEQGKPSIKKEINDIENYENILQSYPLLIYDGEIMSVEKWKKSYRSAIATDTASTYLITTETNPFRKNEITLEEFTKFLHTQNYTHALNLDGGTSSQMYFKNQQKQKTHIRNHRKINNAIRIQKK
jgi:exopolysaccharide biosynthesis protein